MRWHHRLGHLADSKIKLLTNAGILPKSLGKIHPPMCVSCKAGVMTKKPWRTKGNQNRGRLRKVSRLGKCVSKDQIESHAPGFCGVLRGFLTKRRYSCATVFIDHYNNLSYVYLQKYTMVEETIEVKRAFEAYARQYGVVILRYHADNGSFTDTQFINQIDTEQQTISCCAANAHFQNEKAKNPYGTYRNKHVRCFYTLFISDRVL